MYTEKVNKQAQSTIITELTKNETVHPETTGAPRPAG